MITTEDNKSLQIKLQGQINPDELKEDILIGLDTNILVGLIRTPMISQYLDRNFNIFRKKKLVISEISKREVVSVLVNKYNYKESDARKEAEEQIKSLNLTVLELTDSAIQSASKVRIHKPDNFIIASFKENRVNQVFSIDREFITASINAGLFAIKLPSVQKMQDIEFKDLFKRSNI